MLASDFGDAPFPYPTLALANGAEHITGGGLTLGNAVNDDLNGVPSAAADGDAFDDGVSFGDIQTGGWNQELTVEIQGGEGFLDAWIDLNQDGSWSGAAEHIYQNVSVAEGLHALPLNVPAGATSGTTFARFRLSSAGNAGITGIMPDGEVEDYAVEISPPAQGRAFAEPMRLNPVQHPPQDVFPTDLDRDGDLDLLVATGNHAIPNELIWYENNGQERYTPHSISDDGAGTRAVYATDMDRDGDIDLFRAADRSVDWFENDGSQRFTKHALVPTFPPTEAQSIFAVDLDEDGDVDILTAEQAQSIHRNAAIAWYENHGDDRLFTKHEIWVADLPTDVSALDIDSDGDLDLISANSDGIFWHDNDGDESFATRIITTEVDSAVEILAQDMEGDGDIDILSASSGDDTIAWYENDGNQLFSKHSITTTADGAMSVSVADADGDGDVDVFGASVYDSKVAWYENDGSQSFTEHTLSTQEATHSGTFVQSVITADADLDGDVDLIRAAGGHVFGGLIDWFENTGNGEFRVRTIASDSLATNFAEDLDGDGDPDLIGGPNWFENIGQGQFNVRSLPVSEVVSMAADLDADGDLDLLVEGGFRDPALWLENDGTQNFSVHTFSERSEGAGGIDAVDMDQDGDLDVIVASQEGYLLYVNDGDASFTEELTIPTSAPPRSPFDVVDVDRDGDLDIFGTLNLFSSHGPIVWQENLGGGQYLEHTIRDVPDIVWDLVADDVNGDGAMDLIAALDDYPEFNVNSLVWYENDGDEKFTLRTIHSSESVIRDAAAYDVDGDGDRDILSMLTNSQGRATILWHENLGEGDFVAHGIATDLSTSLNFSVFAADLDGDRDLDAIADVFGFTWFESIGDGSQDFGDAPAPYHTSSLDNGPRHLTIGPMLGNARDAENNGQESAEADSDGADDDGVTFGDVVVAGVAQSVDVIVQDGTGKLDAWIDFNADGNWGGAGEQIFDSVTVREGQNTLAFDVPSWAQSGPTYARFRLSTAGDLGFVGAAADGEVEDYVVSISPPARGTDFGPDLLIGDQIAPHAVFAADLDRDGDTDILSAAGDNSIYWYENNGQRGFIRRNISLNAGLPVDVFATDLDGDGDQDVVSASSGSDEFNWYENNGQNVFLARPLSAERNASQITAADIDADGDMDILGASANLVWYENEGDGRFGRHSLASRTDSFDAVATADLDSDGDLDILFSVASADTIGWLENRGNTEFTQRTLALDASGASSVQPVDMDRDGDIDFVAALTTSTAIAWYENDGAERFTRRDITNQAPLATNAFATDMDGDGDTDVLATSGPLADVAWYENNGNQEFTKQLIDAGELAALDSFAADVDGDGDIDVITAVDGEINWHENQGVPAIPPTVTSVTLNRLLADPPAPTADPPTTWATQRSRIATVDIEFSKPTEPTAGDFELVNLGVDADQDPDQAIALMADSVSTLGNIVTLTFTAPLPDGVYSLRVLPTLQDIDGMILDGNGDGTSGDGFEYDGSPENRFFQLTGDLNGDNGTSVFDFNAFAYWFGEAAHLEFGPAPSYADLNRDGGVTIFDMQPFALNFGTTIIFPATKTNNAVFNEAFDAKRDFLSKTFIATSPRRDLWRIWDELTMLVKTRRPNT